MSVVVANSMVRRHGFSLVEAVVAMSIVAIASSVLLLGVEATISSVEEQEEITIADGMARQMLDEIQGQSWVDPALRSQPYQTSLSASADERVGPGRSRFDDTDDYNEYSASPPVRIDGKTLSTCDTSGDTLPAGFQPRSNFLANWRCTVEVAYLSENNHSVQVADNHPTNYRVLICRVFRRNLDGNWRQIVQRERVISYIPAHG
ncbi:type II secretion system protein [Bremerella sp. JC817]|uniref:type II secretion system protein n=1 Tax=Bremerella sp. JC817 TaxID=3231756 RepID=UPI003458230F